MCTHQAQKKLFFSENNKTQNLTKIHTTNFHILQYFFIFADLLVVFKTLLKTFQDYIFYNFTCHFFDINTFL